MLGVDLVVTISDSAIQSDNLGCIQFGEFIDGSAEIVQVKIRLSRLLDICS